MELEEGCALGPHALISCFFFSKERAGRIPVLRSKMRLGLFFSDRPRDRAMDGIIASA